MLKQCEEAPHPPDLREELGEVDRPSVPRLAELTPKPLVKVVHERLDRVGHHCSTKENGHGNRLVNSAAAGDTASIGYNYKVCCSKKFPLQGAA